MCRGQVCEGSSGLVASPDVNHRSHLRTGWASVTIAPMRRSISVVVMAMAATGCENKQPRFEGPLPVTFGDCGGTNLTWVSGPRPRPFTQEQAERVQVANAPKPPAPPPTPPDPAQTAPPKPPEEARAQRMEAVRKAGILGTVTEGGAFASLTGTSGLGGLDDAAIYGGLLGTDAGDPSGGFGFGLTGMDPGGVTGWGTIGTGRYGTIGNSRGGMRGRRAGGPTVSIGQPAATGDLDKTIIRRYIKRNIQKLQYCYEKQLLVSPKLAGTVTAEFTIDPQGKVSGSTASGVDPQVAECVKTVIAGIEFPRPKGGSVVVRYPFTFRSVDGATGSGSGAGAGAGSGSATGAMQDPPAAPPPAPPAPAPTPVPAATPYKAGEHNPLRAEASALEECLRKNPKPYGALVVELGYDASGAVKSATPYGLDGDAAKACVVEIAMKVKRDGAGPAAQRCSIAFGERPPDDGPIIAITAEAITVNGAQVATVKAVVDDPGKATAITALFDRMKRAIDGSLAPSAPVVAIRGPGVIRPLPATPIRVVARVVRSVTAAGDDYVLASQAGAGWRLLRVIEGAVPVVPVPVGTGGSWNAPPGHPRVSAFDPERVHLSLFVSKDHLRVGLSRVNEFQQIKRTGGGEWDELAKLLVVHKASALFLDRQDVEIAGDDGVTYGEVVHVIDAATKAGFTWWQLTDPEQLSARPAP